MTSSFLSIPELGIFRLYLQTHTLPLGLPLLCNPEADRMDGICRLPGPCPLVSGWFHQWGGRAEGGRRVSGVLLPSLSPCVGRLPRSSSLGFRQLLPLSPFQAWDCLWSGPQERGSSCLKSLSKGVKDPKRGRQSPETALARSSASPCLLGLLPPSIQQPALCSQRAFEGAWNFLRGYWGRLCLGTE